MSSDTEALATRLEDLCHDWTIAHECAAGMRRLAAENVRLIEDRARFPDRPDDIGRMIGAHYANLECSIKSLNNAWRGQLLKADVLAADAERYRWLRNRVRGVRTQVSDTSAHFGFPLAIELPPLSDIMRGSVAQHLDAAIDAQIDVLAITPQAQTGAVP